MLERCMNIEVQPECDLWARTKSVVDKVKLMSDTNACIKESLDRIAKYEEQLAAIIKNGSPRDLDIVEVFRSSYCMLERAENQAKELKEELSNTRVALDAKSHEIRHLRSRLTKAENMRISERVDTMKTHLVEIDGNPQGSRRRASETLITAFEESERMRVTLENEMTKLKCALEATQNISRQTEPVHHVFKELAHVEQVNRNLLRQLTNRTVIGHVPKVELPQTTTRPMITFESISDSFRRELELESHEPNYSVRYPISFLYYRNKHLCTDLHEHLHYAFLKFYIVFLLPNNPLRVSSRPALSWT